jgi:hypothetical protein
MIGLSAPGRTKTMNPEEPLKDLIRKVMAHLPFRNSLLRLILPLSSFDYSFGQRRVHMLERRDLYGADLEGRYEAAFCDAFAASLRSDSVVLDVGAAGGLFSLAAAQVCPPENVHAFEPDPIKTYVLTRNNQKFFGGKLNVVSKFVGSRTEKNNITLDDYCETAGIVPSLIKLDIEGWEADALIGAERICRRYQPVILLEYHIEMLEKLFHIDPQTVIARLESYGYHVVFNGHHGHIDLHPDTVDLDWHAEVPNRYNVGVLATVAGGKSEI